MIRVRKFVPLVLVLALLAQFACSSDDVHRVKKKVADAAAILNTAAKSNRSLYQSGVYGPFGSIDAIARRQQVATALHQANEYLSMAVERAAVLTADSFPSGKIDVIALLQKAASALASVHVNNENIQLVISSAVAAINSAILLTEAIKGAK